MIAIFGQGKIGVPLQKLLRHFKIESKSIDYNSWDEELFDSADQIIVHQAVKPDSDIYVKYGHKTISELNFIGQLLDKQPWKDNLSFIGVTGTDGKSTTCHVLYNLLKGLLTDHHLWLSGNFDESIATTLNHIIDKELTDKKHIIVTELSSFLLYGLKDLRFDYSVWTNLSPDHLNWHPDMADYVATKYLLIQHTNKQAFVTPGVMDILHEYHVDLTHAIPITMYGNDYPLDNTQFVGKHNAGNLEVCYLVAKAVLSDIHSVSDEIIHATMNSIKPLDHRIQFIAEKNGIKFYDDSKATSSQALNVALEAFPGPIVLIAGGSDKGDNFSKLGELMKQKLGYGVFIGTTGPQFIQIAKKQGIAHTGAATMEEAVTLAYEYAQQKGINVVLMSPGCASFDMFKDYLDRAHQFIHAVNAL